MNQQGAYLTSSGRKVSLLGLHMKRTWLGLLEGTPEFATERIRKRSYQSLMQEMRVDFAPAQAAIVVDKGWAALPPYQWTALLQGPAIHSTDPDYESRLCICWFSPTIPKDFNQMVAEVISSVEWEDVAEDFDALW